MRRPIFTQQLRQLDISLRIHNQVELWLWNCNKAGNGVGTNPKRHPATDKPRNRCCSVKIILQLQNHLRCTIWWVLEIRFVALLLLSLNCDDHRNSWNSFLAETGVDDLTNSLENCRSNGVTWLHKEKENYDQIFLEIQQRSPSRFSMQHFIIW